MCQVGAHVVIDMFYHIDKGTSSLNKWIIDRITISISLTVFSSLTMKFRGETKNHVMGLGEARARPVHLSANRIWCSPT